MSGDPLKFRCYQCNQLLGVSRSKIGAVVACPKCRTDLIVPDPDAVELPPNSSDAGLDLRDYDTERNEPLFPADLLDIRPEDIRVEHPLDWPRPSPEIPRESAVEAELERRSGSAVESFVAPSNVSAPGAGFTAEPVPTQRTAPTQVITERAEVVPPIQLEPSSVLKGGRVGSSRSRDVTLPRSTVVFWSFFVLVAQAFAFLAGLLAGHFLWRVH